MDWYIQVWKKYAVFSGRARRKEYWYFALFNTLVLIGLAVIDGILRGVPIYRVATLVLLILYYLAVIIPAFAVSVRRLHDTGHSGWWMCIGFIPLIGAIILLAFHATDSQPGENRYGASPKLRSGFEPTPIG